MSESESVYRAQPHSEDGAELEGFLLELAFLCTSLRELRMWLPLYCPGSRYSGNRVRDNEIALKSARTGFLWASPKSSVGFHGPRDNFISLFPVENHHDIRFLAWIPLIPSEVHCGGARDTLTRIRTGKSLSSTQKWQQGFTDLVERAAPYRQRWSCICTRAAPGSREARACPRSW